MYVINFDDAVIFEVKEESRFYDKHYSTFEEAKTDLIDYWDRFLKMAQTKLSESNLMKKVDVKTFI